jgi:hypothetical protein
MRRSQQLEALWTRVHRVIEAKQKERRAGQPDLGHGHLPDGIGVSEELNLSRL